MRSGMPDLLHWAQRFIATPSVSSLGNAAIAGVAAELLEELRIDARVESVLIDGVLQHAVIAERGPRAGGSGLLLVTHLDTVPPGDPADWTSTGGDPYRPRREGDRLFGLGSADVKPDFVCKALALSDLGARDLRRPVRLVGTFGEEIGLQGARWLVESGALEDMRYALVGEPSDLVAIHAHKGYAKFEARVRCRPVAGGKREWLRLRGESAHSSTPELGRNAIESALESLAKADVDGVIDLCGGSAVNQVPDACELELTRTSAAGERTDALDPAPLLAFHGAWRRLMADLTREQNACFAPAHALGNLGKVERMEGGFRFAFDLRTLPGQEANALAAPLARVAEIVCTRSNPPLATPRDCTLMRRLAAAQRSCGVAERSGTKGTCTEAGLLAEAGLECAVFGPGVSIGNIHRPNEHTRVSQLAHARDVYRDVIRRFCVDL
jgi:acetylornithine deacetylase/succinyl-diaminopimelate desuccinylase-like protein